MAIIRMSGIGRRFPGQQGIQALSGIDLEVGEGEFIAIEGESGGGKSTLLNIIGLLDRASSGGYVLNDRPIERLSDRALAELRSNSFAFIFQSFHLLERRPVVDSVELGLLYRGIPALERRRRALAALKRVGLEQFALQRANKLSGGQRQRVAIARALAAQAPVVVADEPTGNLDTENSRSVVQSLLDLNRSGSTVVLVTHSADIAEVADRRIGIRDGRIVSMTPNERVDRPVAASPIPPGHPSRLRLRDLAGDAWRSIGSRPGRSAALIAAVGLGVALAIATLGISVSASAQVSDTFDAHANRDVTAQWSRGGLSNESIRQRGEVIERLGSLAGVDRVSLLSNYSSHALQVSPARSTFDVTLYGAEGDAIRSGRLSVAWAPGHEHSLKTGEVLIGSNLASQIALGPLSAGPGLAIDGSHLTVVGIIRHSPRIPDLMGSVLARTPDVPSEDLVERVQALILTSSGAAQQVARQADSAIDPYSPNSIAVNAPTDPGKLRQQVQSELETTLFALTGVSLLAAVAGIANALFLSVVERRQELGLRRALGARAKHLAALISAESLLIGLFGGAGGLLSGLLVILVVTVVRRWAPVFDFRLAPLALVAGAVIGALGGVIAASRAARVQPHEALRL